MADGAGSRDRPQVQTRRGHETRERIVAAATDLFDRNGYHATGIDEIGAAAGITGPGIYRHFASKDDILMEVFDRIWWKLRDAVSASRELEADAALELLVRTHVELVVDDRAATTLFFKEFHSLPAAYRRKVLRNDATYQDAWARPIGRLHPDLSADEARIVGRACFWAINAYDTDTAGGRLAPERAKELLAALAYGVLGAP